MTDEWVVYAVEGDYGSQTVKGSVTRETKEQALVAMGVLADYIPIEDGDVYLELRGERHE